MAVHAVRALSVTSGYLYWKDGSRLYNKGKANNQQDENLVFISMSTYRYMAHSYSICQTASKSRLRTKSSLAIIFALSLTSCAPLPNREGYVYCSYQARLSECITVPLASASDDAQAKQFAPPEGNKGRLYLVRPSAGPPTIKSQVFLDGRMVTEIAPHTYLVLDIDPGKHVVKVHTQEDAILAIDIAPGQIYYVQYQQDLYFHTLRDQLTRLDADQAQLKIRYAKRVALPQ